MRTTSDKRHEQKDDGGDKLIERNKNEDQRASRVDVNEERVDVNERCEKGSDDGCDERYNGDAATASQSACCGESSERSKRPKCEAADERLEALPGVCHHAECANGPDRNDCVSDTLHRDTEWRSSSNENKISRPLAEPGLAWNERVLPMESEAVRRPAVGCIAWLSLSRGGMLRLAGRCITKTSRPRVREDLT